MNDSIGLYLNDIGKVALLTAEDEREFSFPEQFVGQCGNAGGRREDQQREGFSERFIGQVQLKLWSAWKYACTGGFCWPVEKRNGSMDTAALRHGRAIRQCSESKLSAHGPNRPAQRDGSKPARWESWTALDAVTSFRRN